TGRSPKSTIRMASPRCGQIACRAVTAGEPPHVNRTSRELPEKIEGFENHLKGTQHECGSHPVEGHFPVRPSLARLRPDGSGPGCRPRGVVPADLGPVCTAR